MNSRQQQADGVLPIREHAVAIASNTCACLSADTHTQTNTHAHLFVAQAALLVFLRQLLQHERPLLWAGVPGRDVDSPAQHVCDRVAVGWMRGDSTPSVTHCSAARAVAASVLFCAGAACCLMVLYVFGGVNFFVDQASADLEVALPGSFAELSHVAVARSKFLGFCAALRFFSLFQAHHGSQTNPNSNIHTKPPQHAYMHSFH